MSGVDSPKKPSSVFRVGQRVIFHDKNGDKHYGVVEWTGREGPAKKFDYPVVGIKTVRIVFNVGHW